MKKFDFQIEMQVRDYECDIQGIVNNAVYQNYLEHCRHEFLNSAGLNFSLAHNDGIDGVVIRAEVEYKFPLRPGDEFIIGLKMAKQGRLRLIFNQQIIRKIDKKIIVTARITTVLTKNNRPISSDFFIEKMEKGGIRIEEG